MKDRQFAVIGIGRFGSNMVKELVRMGYEVLAIDSNPASVEAINGIATHTVEADSTDEKVLKSLGIRNFDVVVIAIGDNIQSNILTTILVKEMGTKMVVAKAQNELHGRVLEKVGADLVVYPERDMAFKIAHQLASTRVVDMISLSSEYSIMEIVTPVSLVGKSIARSAIRERLKVNILAIKREDDLIVAPDGNEPIQSGDLLVAIGKLEDLERLSNMGK